MSDISEIIEQTGESIEDLQEGLEPLLADILGTDVAVDAQIGTDHEGAYVEAWVEFPDIEDDLRDELGAVDVDARGLKLVLGPERDQR